jgi:uncharacterized membrane protein YbhN (UPF0104 family)
MKLIKNKYLNLLVSIFGFIMFLYLFTTNVDYGLFRNIAIKPVSIFLVFSLFNIRLFLRAILQINLLKSLDIKLTFNESLKITALTRFGNTFSFFKLGSGYKIHYYLKHLKINLKDNVFLNLLQLSIESYQNINLILLSAILIFDKDKLPSNFLEILLIANLSIIFFSYFSKIFFRKSLLFNNFNNLNIIFLIKIFFITGLVSFVNIFLSFIIFGIFDNSISLIQVNMFYNLGNLINIISITPGNIGIFEFLIINLESFHSILPEIILLTSVFSRLFDYIISIIYFLLRNKIFSY